MSQIILEESNRFYQKGASWNGEALLYVGGTIAVIAAIGFIAFNIWLEVTHDCAEYEYKRKSGNDYRKVCVNWVKN